MVKHCVQRYPIDIYNRILFVATEKDLPYLEKLFTFCKPENAHEPNEKAYETIAEAAYDAITVPVIEKATNRYGVLIIITKSGMRDAYNVIPHEAVHATDYVFEECGLNSEEFSEGNEHYAYLVGWISGKISNAVIKKKCK